MSAPLDATEDTRVTASFVAREVRRLVGLFVTDPAAGLHRIRRGIGVLRAITLFRGCELGTLVNALGHVRVLKRGTIRLGDRVQLSGGMLSTELLCHEGAEIVVGPHAFFNYGVSIEARKSVRIGARCMFGSMVRIRDFGEGGALAAVTIGDDVWVAHGAIVEAGSTLGDGAVVAAGTVVRGNVPPLCLAVGNPATIIPIATSRPPRSAVVARAQSGV